MVFNEICLMALVLVAGKWYFVGMLHKNVEETGIDQGNVQPNSKKPYTLNPKRNIKAVINSGIRRVP
jgi:hypothetical protein